MILDKHNETKYTVSTQHHFPFEYYHMGWKWVWCVHDIPAQFWSEAISKGDALDVDQELEYVEMVNKVHEAEFTKIIIMVDFEDVKRKRLITVDVHTVPIQWLDIYSTHMLLQPEAMEVGMMKKAALR